MCFTNSYDFKTSTSHFSPGPCDVPTSVQCPYVPISNRRGVSWMHESVTYLAQGSPLMRHNTSVKESNRHIALKNRISSVCGFSNNVFFSNPEGQGFSVKVSFPY